MASTKYGPTPTLGTRQKKIIRVLKSQPLNWWRLTKRLDFPPSWAWRSTRGLIEKGIVEKRRDAVYGDTYRLTPKGRAIANRRGVIG